MKTYLSFFKMKFVNGLQYRAAAYAGVATQLAWGFMYIMLYHSFYKSNQSAVPMDFDKLTSYIWLQQSFLALFMVWFLDKDIEECISSGNVAYELTRPIDLYDMWFMRNLATRYSKALLRCFPILFISWFLPATYKFNGPESFENFILFIISLILGSLLVVSYIMLIYIFSFYTLSPQGIEITMVMIADFLSGGLVPLPLLPNWMTRVIYLTPFAGMQNTPFRIYTGDISISESLYSIAMQIIWIVILVFIGKVIMSKSLKKVVVQGG